MSRSAPARPRLLRTVAAALAVVVVPLGIIVAGMGSASPAATVYEAENATPSQAAVATNPTGITGTGVVDYNPPASNSRDGTGGAPAAGSFRVTVGDAAGSRCD